VVGERVRRSRPFRPLVPTITEPIVWLASAPSRRAALRRPREAGLTALIASSAEPCLGSYVMVGRSFALLRPIADTNAQEYIRELVLQAYAEYEEQMRDEVA
jgi:hypothetical protein